jgi:hypothetical protein
MTTINQQIFDKSLSHQSNVVDFAGTNANVLSDTLIGIYIIKELRALILSFLAEYSTGDNFNFLLQKNLSALNRLEKDITRLRKSQYDSIQKQTLSLIKDFIKEEKETQQDIIYGDYYKPEIPTNASVYNYFLAMMIVGNLFTDNFDIASNADIKRITQTLRYGLSQNQTNTEIVNSITGTQQNKYQDGVLNTSVNQLNSVVNSSIIAAQSAVIDNFNILNTSGLVMYGQFVAVLDSRTSVICQTLSGKEGKYEDLPHPPLHPRCRSHIAVYFKRMTGVSKANLGGVPRESDYMQWLKKQNEQTQIAVLGEKRTELLGENKLTVSDFYTRNGDLLTLNELYRKYDIISSSVN